MNESPKRSERVYCRFVGSIFCLFKNQRYFPLSINYMKKIVKDCKFVLETHFCISAFFREISKFVTNIQRIESQSNVYINYTNSLAFSL